MSSGDAQRIRQETKLRRSPNARKGACREQRSPPSRRFCTHVHCRGVATASPVLRDAALSISHFIREDVSFVTRVFSHASHTEASKSPLLFLPPPRGLSLSRPHFPLVSLTLPVDHSKSSWGQGQKPRGFGESWHWELQQHRHPVPAGRWSFLSGTRGRKKGVKKREKRKTGGRNRGKTK